MARVKRVVAPNPGPYTGPGTNTWIIAEAPAAVVIDPGPDDAGHLEAISAGLEGLPVGVVLVTHSHPDHLPLAAGLASAHQARVLRHPDLRDGDVVTVGRVRLTALHTPGHAPDHLAFWMPEDRVLFTGDLVLGSGSTTITHPEGDVAAFLASLARVRALEPRMLFPGHWDPVTDAIAKLDEYREHRLAREAQVLAELRRGPGTAADLTRRVYAAEIARDAALATGAEMTLRAHLSKLVADGAAVARGEVFEAA